MWQTQLFFVTEKVHKSHGMTQVISAERPIFFCLNFTAREMCLSSWLSWGSLHTEEAALLPQNLCTITLPHHNSLRQFLLVWKHKRWEVYSKKNVQWWLGRNAPKAGLLKQQEQLDPEADFFKNKTRCMFKKEAILVCFLWTKNKFKAILLQFVGNILVQTTFGNKKKI